MPTSKTRKDQKHSGRKTNFLLPVVHRVTPVTGADVPGSISIY